MAEKKSIGQQIFSFIKTIAGAISVIIIVLILLIVVPNIIRGCQGR